MIRRYLPKNIDELAQWYMRYISPIALVGGFVADNLVLLRRVDLWTSNLLLFSYIALAASCILLINLIETGRLRAPWLLKVTPLIPVVAQFAFGGLFSGYLSLYSRSAAFAGSAVFVLLLAALLLGNERFVRFYMRFSFQMGIFFTVLMSFFIFFLPVVFRAIGPWIFIASGLTAVAVFALFFYMLSKVVPEPVARDRTAVARAVAIIFVTFNILYFVGAIPPLPLALKDAGVYHSITRLPEPGFAYRITAEPKLWYDFIHRYNSNFHYVAGERAYAWSAIFAPTGFSTTIVHEWQSYDVARGEWTTTNTVQIPILGGRDGGFRTYSFKTGLSAGEWRVNVLTIYGQLIGRISFTVIEGEPPALVELTK
ncbi:MAG: DUF2914 domain-containing protein [bacterium]|nr:DUF2914 domain-containing protein [bacterium]